MIGLVRGLFCDVVWGRLRFFAAFPGFQTAKFYTVRPATSEQ